MHRTFQVGQSQVKIVPLAPHGPNNKRPIEANVNVLTGFLDMTHNLSTAHKEIQLAGALVTWGSGLIGVVASELMVDLCFL
jgi:hypothetical protein